jgi:hypothetical protein
MNFLERRIMSAKLARAQYAIRVSGSPFTLCHDLYREQAGNILRECINQLNRGVLND